MRIELDDKQVKTLEEVLVSVMAETRMEIAQTDSPDFKDGLRAHKEVLQSILDRLHAEHAG